MLNELNHPFIVGTMRFGKWGANLSAREYEYFIDGCLDLGLSCFDHADIYGAYSTEEEFGQVIKKRPELKNKIQIITKCGIRYVSENRKEHKIKSYDTSSGHIRASLERSLLNLGIDSIDLLLIHRPDHLMDPEEIADTISELKKEGKLKAFGVSNFSCQEFDLLNNLTPLSSNQIEFSLVQRKALEDGTLTQCMQHKIRPTIWSPLGGGVLFKKSCSEALDKVLYEIGEKYGLNKQQVLLKWIMTHPSAPLPVLGTTKIERLKEALDSADTRMKREEWYELLEAASGQEVA